MPRAVRIALDAAAVGLVVAGIAACGSSGGKGSAVHAYANPANADNGAGGKRGGILNLVSSGDVSHLDPGLSYYTLDYEFIYATQRPLYSYKPNDQTKPVPDLASGAPQVSPDNMTITVHIRPGVHFSPPVNREVTSADVAYAIERGFNPHVANPYAGLYYNKLVGADKATGGPIPGIQTPDKYTLVFALSAPIAGFVAESFVLPLSAPVPKEYAQKFDAHTPSDYGNFQVATGPYKFKSDAAGKVIGIGYETGRRITLVRNPNWAAATDFRPAYLDGVSWSIGLTPEIAGRQTLTGRHMVMGDTPPADIVKLAAQRYRSQIFFSPGAGNRYVALNTAVAPFNDANLRKAVFASLNRRQMVTVRGGALVDTVATHFLFPGVAGFEQAGGLAGPGYDFTAAPTGNVAVAAMYMKRAGYPTGRYTGRKPVTVVGATGAPSAQDADIVNQALQNLGFRTNYRLADPSIVLSKFCGTPSLKVQVCPNLSWVRDFADPQTVLVPTFEGSSITATNNTNISQLNDPAINAAMEQAKLISDAAARAAAWAKIDDMITASAAAVPFAWDNQPVVYSKDVECVNDLAISGPCDISFSSLK